MKNIKKEIEKLGSILGSISEFTNEKLVCCYTEDYEKCDFITNKDYVRKTIDWLLSECEETNIDWSKVKIDTKVMVSNDNKKWFRRYFAEYKNDKICTFIDGKTSWSVDSLVQFFIGCKDCEHWKYAKFADEE